jgi:serine phosphatase RsbU (regulator of sigma subunit)
MMLPRLISKAERRIQERKKEAGDYSDLSDRSLENYFNSFPQESQVRNLLQNAFVINDPLERVGGDGYWIHEKEGVIFVIAFDCMGHGRLASIMTRIYISAITQTIVEDNTFDPGNILDTLHLKIQNYFEQKTNTQVGSGADIGVLKLDFINAEIQFAGAKMDLLFNTKGTIERIRGARKQVGDLFHVERRYETFKLDLEDHKGTIELYLFSDGVTDLMGGPHAKKLKLKGLLPYLEAMQQCPFHEQKDFLYKKLSNWSGQNQQTDDLLFIGLSV